MTKRKCKRRDCDKPARKGWTHCSQHYSAGDSVKNASRKKPSRLNEEIARIREEVALWKDRYESLLADAQASERHYDKMLSEGSDR